VSEQSVLNPADAGWDLPRPFILPVTVRAEDIDALRSRQQLGLSALGRSERLGALGGGRVSTRRLPG